MDSSGVANHVVALVKGVTTSQTIDMAVVLQVSLAFMHAQLCSIMQLPPVSCHSNFVLCPVSHDYYFVSLLSAVIYLTLLQVERHAIYKAAL